MGVTIWLEEPETEPGPGHLLGRRTEISGEDQMTSSSKKILREIDGDPRPALSGNGALAGRDEAYSCLGCMVEAVFEEDVDQRILEKFLERVSVLQGVPYGAHFELDEDHFVLTAEHAAFPGSSPSGAKLSLPGEIVDAVTNGDGSSHGAGWDVSPACMTFEAVEFQIRAMLALPCIIRNRSRGVFLFADDRRTRAQLRALLPVLEQMGRIVRNRLEHLALLRGLSELERPLDPSSGERPGDFEWVTPEEEVAGPERCSAQMSLRQAAAALDNTSEGVIIADGGERIIAVNRAFTEVTGFEAAEVIGKTPRMFQSGRHDRAFYANMWRSICETGRWQGEIWNRKKNGSVYPEFLNLSVVRDDTGSVAHYVGVFSDQSAMKESEARFDHMAHYDALTNLPNRLLFRSRVEHAILQAQRTGRRLAILILGLDGFKNLNESLGQTAGDELLRQVAGRLRGLNRESNTVARHGGDEFGILLEDVTDAESVGRAGWNMLEGVAIAFEVEGRKVFLTSSAGISLYPDNGTDFMALIQSAEIALHRAKQSRAIKYQFYNAEMTERAYDRFVIESDLRRALRRNEFVLHFQPQFSFGTGQLIGMEALARWQHPERGLVPPYAFIPVAEETGLIEGLGDWAVREACRQAVLWQAAAAPPVRVAVNLSAKQIARSGVVETVAGALRDSGLAAELLELEITEGFLMENPEAARETLHRLKDLGVSLAIDDFGTGYSSLSYLKIFPIDRLKIDQSFVRDIPFHVDDQAIARAIITLGHGLSLKVIAEGVETREQGDFLRANHCDEVQGYLYGRPMVAAGVDDFLNNLSPR